MFRTERETRLVRALPAFTVMSLTAATTLAMAAPALAAPARGGHPGGSGGLTPPKYSQHKYSQRTASLFGGDTDDEPHDSFDGDTDFDGGKVWNCSPGNTGTALAAKYLPNACR